MSEPVMISIDCEYTGPAVSNGELLSIGAVACQWDESGKLWVPPFHENSFNQFSVNLARVSHRQEKDTMKWWENYPAQFAIATSDTERPMYAMGHFAQWAESFDQKVVFCAWPAAADWQYVNSYLWQYVERNPFGYSPFCLKNYAMGKLGKIGAILGHREDAELPEGWDIKPESLGLTSHVALHDAYAQAVMLCNIVNAP